MRVRTGNPFQEAHGLPMRCFDWVAPAGTDPKLVPARVEAQIAGLKLEVRGGEQNGFVLTSLRPDGSLYVSVQLYDHECADPACPGGHWPVIIRAAPVLSPGDQGRLTALVGADPRHLLTGTPADDLVLRQLGFGTEDGPRRAG